MKKEEFYAAWIILEKVEKTLHMLDRHLRTTHGEYGLEFIRASTTRFQSLYPYQLFISPEIWKQEVRCGLCDAVITLRGNCGHKLNEIYDGKRCYRRITKSILIALKGLVSCCKHKRLCTFAAECLLRLSGASPEGFSTAASL